MENRPFYGAYLNLLVGDYTNVGISPFIGYGITRTTEIGVGPFYQHTFIRRNDFSSYGGRAFLRQGVYKQFFAQAEYEYMDTRDAELSALAEDRNRRIQVSSLLLGAGYYGGVGGRTRMHMTVLFNVLDNDYRPYNQPMIRIGFSRNF